LTMESIERSGVFGEIARVMRMMPRV